MNFDLQIHHITFTCEAQTLVHMGAQAGGQIRGALWQALSDIACTAPQDRHLPLHDEHCPMCFLLEREKNSPRGQNPPRPFTIQPPLATRAEDDRQFKVGECFEIGMNLMGRAGKLFPYLVQSMRLLGEAGLGYGRGRFSIIGISSHHPLTKERQSLLDGNTVFLPNIMLSADDIQAYAQVLPADSLSLRFITPMTIKHKGKILSQPEFMPLLARLLERCQAMAFHYGLSSADSDLWQPEYLRLTTLAKDIQVTYDNSRWVEVKSGSRRSNRYQKIGGFVGEVQFSGDMRPFQQWILWGQSLQLGKHVVKGNGWYTIQA